MASRTNEAMVNAKKYFESEYPALEVRSGVEMNDSYVFNIIDRSKPEDLTIPPVRIYKETGKIEYFIPVTAAAEYSKACDRTYVRF